MKKTKYCFSLRKFLILKIYDDEMDMSWYRVYGRIAPFIYRDLCDLDDTCCIIMDNFD